MTVEIGHDSPDLAVTLVQNTGNRQRADIGDVVEARHCIFAPPPPAEAEAA